MRSIPLMVDSCLHTRCASRHYRHAELYLHTRCAVTVCSYGSANLTTFGHYRHAELYLHTRCAVTVCGYGSPNLATFGVPKYAIVSFAESLAQAGMCLMVYRSVDLHGVPSWLGVYC